MERLILRRRKTRKYWWRSRTAAAAAWSSFFPSGPGSSSGACFHRGLPPVPLSLCVRQSPQREGIYSSILRTWGWPVPAESNERCWKWRYVLPAYLLRRLAVSTSWVLKPWVRGPGCSAAETGHREEDWEADTRGRAPCGHPGPHTTQCNHARDPKWKLLSWAQSPTETSDMLTQCGFTLLLRVVFLAYQLVTNTPAVNYQHRNWGDISNP